MNSGSPRPKGPRNVTFSANPVTRTIEPESSRAQPKSGQQVPGTTNVAVGSGATLHIGPKQGAQRSTKKTEKLKLLPNPELDEDNTDEESGRDVYSQYTRIKDPTARRDAARLGKADRDRLPRVTAYCTANRYEMEGLQRFLKGRGKNRGANPKLIDECIYTPYSYGKTPQTRPLPPPPPVPLSAEPRPDPVQVYERRHSTGGDSIEDEQQRRETFMDGHPDAPDESDYADQSAIDVDVGPLHGDTLLGPSIVDDERPVTETIPDLDITVHTPEVFLFDYGVVVIWGMTEIQEKRFLKDIAKFELEKLAPDDVETEHFNFYYTHEYQARIYNDFITLRDKNNYMTKLAISHALAQSVKTSLFEELIASTVDTCKDIPTQIALTGKIALTRSQINMQIGELFILRINIHLNGSVLDTPELFWVEPQLEPVYQAVRSYLEMDQRVGLLTERLDVIADLLAVLKDQLSHGHGEKLEWIVIVLIAAEIVVAAVNIVVDLYAGE
ncbi:Sporulation protein-like protein [Emericellopsis cladophorae]|uniref:Sporulation protein-like protein n=1 Tax=Emericellopsis cladophorae TaxID=2686198 RepID=A0A9P9Y2A1_9HYPO|nr:Sporulation protein-like protein [Emericellopsis cladophorae]KAI6782199.1 Sporulation protein-like protein [Emericellopsis cladophorae]